MRTAPRALATAAVALLLVTACQVQRAPAPVGVGLLRAGTPERLTDRAALSPAAWAPDGAALAYADRAALWIHPLRGRERRVAAVGVATQVEWSRATDLLAYIDRGEVFVIRPDGQARRRLKIPADGTAPFATHLAWAPGSDRLAVGVRSGGAPRGAVWLLSPDGGFVRRVLPGTDPDGQVPTGHVVAALEWFADSLFLFIGTERDGEPGVTRLYRWRITYPDRRRLVLPQPRIFLPRLSPDGRWIAYTAPERQGGEQVWVMRTDGTLVPRRLSADPGRITSLAWAPTSDKVAFARVLDEAHGEVWLVDVAPRERIRVAAFTAEFPDPNLPLVLRWSGDGQYLAFGSNSGSYTGPVWVVRLERR